MRIASLVLSALLLVGCLRSEPVAMTADPVHAPSIAASTPTSEDTISDGLSDAERSARDVSVKINFASGGYCSGTIIGKNAILTASHCIHGKLSSVRIDESLTRVTRVIKDESDHSILIVQDTFEKVAEIAELPGVGTRIFMWGNSRFDDLFRRGYVMGHYSIWWENGIGTHKNMVMDMMVAGGDSGSGVFDERGRLVGVASGTFGWEKDNPSAIVSCALEYTFTARDLAGVSVNSKHLIGK